MKSIIVLFLTFILTMANLFSQCSSSVLISKMPELSFNNYSLKITNSDTTYVFTNDSISFVSSRQIPDSSPIDGTWLLYYENNPDSILLEVTYLNGAIHGKVKIYDYPEAKLASVNNYNSGKLNGEQLYYNQKGMLEYIKPYNMGNLDGNLKRWYYNGKPYKDETYSNGLKNGAFYEWDDKGRITKYAYFENGVNKGASLFFSKGKLRLVHYYHNAEQIRGVEYYTEPKQQSRRNRKEGQSYEAEFIIKEDAILTDSIWQIRKYYPSGILKSEEYEIYIGENNCEKIYHKTGEHKFWNENNQLIKVECYKKNMLVKTEKIKN